MLRLETKYLVAKSVGDSSLNSEKKDFIISNVSCIQEVFVQDIMSCQNGIIVGMNDIIDTWGLYGYDHNFLRLAIVYINSVIVQTEKNLICNYNRPQIDYNWLMCPESEKLFKCYFGDGQHITYNKEWSKSTLNNFRKLYNQ